MEILFENNRFHLRNDHMSYIIQLVAGKYLAHAYWGARLESLESDMIATHTLQTEESFTLHGMPFDMLPQEYPTYGHGDLREGALHVVHADGSRILELAYASHTIKPGKPALEGLPSSFASEGECLTLCLTMRDAVSGLVAELSYTVFDELDVIARSVRVVNEGKTAIRVEKLLSACVDFAESDYRLLTLSGAWSRERDIVLRPLAPGEQATGSLRGASSHQSSPFFALLSPDAGEDHGEVYSMALVYSGNFYAGVFVDQYDTARAQIGIHPFDFSWLLGSGEAFQSPEALLVYSGDGLRGMSRSYHGLCRRHIARGKYVDQIRPMLINNWEATYFDFDEEKLLQIARAAKETGVEMFVLDDGWFGHRDKDDSSLGDWVEDKRKLPGGLEQLSGKIHDMGLLFGLWFEPEMISADSDLYRAHPDWCIHVENRERLEWRQQLVLDLSREEVCDHIISAVSDVLARGGIDYVKWDMNRNMLDIGSAKLPAERQMELPHRYMLGLYRVLETITARFPDILFESCAGGGGRFDLGMLHYMPQAWTSDNTDAIARCKIQYATSLVFPPETMGAHVSAVPNHQTGRRTPLSTRANVAMGGTYGYELDLTKLPGEELAEMTRLNAYVKKVRQTLLFGDFYRLRNPFSGNETGWMSVSPDKSEAVVTWVSTLSRAFTKPKRLRLAGLDAHRRYRVEGTDKAFGGDELMHYGLTLPLVQEDYQSASYHLVAEDK